MTAYAGYNNLIEGATVTVTDAVAGYPKENAYDWLTYDWWLANSVGAVEFHVDLGSAMAVDCWGLASHDLGSNTGTIKPQYSTDDVNWNDFDVIQSPADDQVLFHVKPEVTARYWKFQIDSPGASSHIGALFLGKALQFPYGMEPGFIPPAVADVAAVSNNISHTGQFLGRSTVRINKSFSISQRKIDADWVLTNWPAFYEHIIKKPFFFVWNAETYPNDATFCWTTPKQKSPSYEDSLNMRFTLNLEGL